MHGSFWRGFWRGMAEAVGIPLAFVVAGLGLFEGAVRAGPAAAAYPGRVPLPDALQAPESSGTSETPGPPEASPETWLVDGFNVVQVALLGGRDRHAWWSSAQRAELLSRAEGFDDADAPVVVVFDGARVAADEPEGRVRRVFAPSADEWLVDRVRRDAAAARLVVVTADRRLAGRVRRHGARVVSPIEFLERCRPLGAEESIARR